MTEILLHEPHYQTKTNQRNRYQGRMRSRAEVETMLRDIAFVLRMTARVRGEIDNKRDVEELMLA